MVVVDLHDTSKRLDSIKNTKVLRKDKAEGQVVRADSQQLPTRCGQSLLIQ
jgi:hypothetical protein